MRSSADQPIGKRLLRRTIAVFLVPIVFVIFGRLADQTLTHLARVGFRGLPLLSFLLAAVVIAYAAFATIVYFASTSRRPITIHGIAAGVTVIWLLFLMARSTLTESG